MQKCTIPLELGAWRGPYHAHCPSRWCRRSQRRHRPFDRKGVGQSWRVVASSGTKPGQTPSTPLGYSSTTAWSPISANRGRGRGSVPVPGQIGDGRPVPVPGQIGDGDGDGDRGVRALAQPTQARYGSALQMDSLWNRWFSPEAKAARACARSCTCPFLGTGTLSESLVSWHS